MRLNNKNWTISKGIIRGHLHDFNQSNCQDAVHFEVVYDNCFFGIICDGCSSGECSEVGAKLILESLSADLKYCLSVSHIDSPFNNGRGFKDRIPDLFINTCNFIDRNLELISTNEKHTAELINKYWCSTILILAIQGNQGYFISAGDGIFIKDDEIQSIFQNNYPNYIAYNCLENPDKFGVDIDAIKTEFIVREFDISNVKKLMISSDGFETHNENKLSVDNLPISLHNEQWNKKGQVGLQKWINAKHKLGYFSDDCSIVVAERID